MDRNTSGEKMQFSRMMVYAGAVMSLLIGAAFATGQEVLMYFVAWGSDMYAVVGLVLAIIIWVALSFAVAGSRYSFRKNEEIFTFFCGKYFGKLYDYFTAFFSFACYLFMLGGVGSTVKEQFGLPPVIGIIGLSAVVILTVSLGLRKITDILGFLGTILLVVILLISTATLLLNFDQIPINNEKLNLLGPEYFGIEKSIAPNVLMNALNYMGTIAIWFITFITMMAVQSERKKEVKIGSVAGAVLFIGVLLVVAFAMISVLPAIGASDVPSIIMATNIWKPLATIYSVIVIGGSFTTAVPLLWTPVSRFAEDGSAKARAIAIILGVVGAIVALFVPYKTLMNYVMNIGGMMAYVMFVFILWTDIRMLKERKDNKQK